jgi:hypothetical protein
MLTPLESEVLKVLLEEDAEPFVSIRRQLSHAIVVKREFTGVGFFTDFEVPLDAPVRRDLPDATLGDVCAELPTLQHGAGFALFVRNGVVLMLEGFTYDEPWPTSTDVFNVYRPHRI